MRTRISPKFIEFAVNVGKIPFLKKLLRPLYDSYRQHIRNNRNRAYRKNALDILKEFDEVMIENGFRYSVYAGTLLGAIREKGFIKHDIDIDTVMFNKDYSEKLQDVLLAAGFKKIHSYMVEDGKLGREETYEKKSVTVDIFYVYDDGISPIYQCDFCGVPGSYSHEHSMKKFGYVIARKLEFPVSYEVLRLPFETIEVNVMSNYKEWLTGRYGSDFMIPNPKFHDKGDNPAIKVWSEVKAKMLY